MTKRSRNDMENLLQCPICNDNFTAPVRLPCSHLVCFHCFVELRKHSLRQDVFEKALRWDCHCPICRRSAFTFSMPDHITFSLLGDVDVKRIHPDTCPRCKRNLRALARTSMYEHFKICITAQTYICPHCKDEFGSRSRVVGDELEFLRKQFTTHRRTECQKNHCLFCHNVGNFRSIQQCENMHEHIRKVSDYVETLEEAYYMFKASTPELEHCSPLFLPHMTILRNFAIRIGDHFGNRIPDPREVEDSPTSPLENPLIELGPLPSFAILGDIFDGPPPPPPPLPRPEQHPVLPDRLPSSPHVSAAQLHSDD